ncbi:unnamed protein product [Rotaria sp. Silwood2]|nr:unnamed protein product [Rotaria sp. Silwood2]
MQIRRTTTNSRSNTSSKSSSSSSKENNVRNIEPVLYSEVAVRFNENSLEQCRTSVSALSGCVAGILGLTSYKGFIFYAFSMFFLSFLIYLCAFIYGKRRLEAYITQLEEELEEEQTNTEIICDKHKKLAIIVEQLMLDLAAEKVNNQKAEAEKASVRVRNMKRREEEVTQMKTTFT